MDNKDYRLAVLGKMLEMAEKHCFEDEFRNDLIEPMFGLNMTYDAKEWVLTVEITKNDDDFRTE